MDSNKPNNNQPDNTFPDDYIDVKSKGIGSNPKKDLAKILQAEQQKEERISAARKNLIPNGKTQKEVKERFPKNPFAG